MKKKKQYVITYTCIFTTGYVKNTWIPFKSKEIRLNIHQEGINFATKFRFKKIAELWCKILQWSSNKNFDFKDYKVITLNNC